MKYFFGYLFTVFLYGVTVSAHELTFDPERESFSFKGSSIAVTENNRIADVSGHNPWRRNRVCEIGFLVDGTFTNAAAIGRPEALTYTPADTVHEVAFENERTLRFRGAELPMALRALEDVEIMPDGSRCLIQKGEARYVLSAQKGSFSLTDDLLLVHLDTNGAYEAALEVTDAS